MRGRVDAGAELGVAEEPIQNRAQLARTPAPILRRTAEFFVSPTVAGMFRRRNDEAALCQMDRRVAVIQAPAPGPVR